MNGEYGENPYPGQERLERYLAEQTYWAKLGNKESLKKVAWIALVRFPKIYSREGVPLIELKKRLKDIREAGYDIKYSNLDTEKAWNCLRKVRKDVRSELEKHSPETLKEIEKENRRLENIV